MSTSASTGQQVRQGLKWVAASQATAQGARFLSNAILARLLVPEMFGLVAMANVAIQLLGVIREIGFGQAYIQRRTGDAGEARRLASTAFFVSASLNLALFAGAVALAPSAAGFFQTPEAEPVLRWMFLSFALDALFQMPALVLQKRLEFGRLAIGEIAGSGVLIATAIGLALAGAGVWSLVAGHLAAKAVQGAILFGLAGWRPRLEFDRRLGTELFAYGKYIWAFTVISAVGGTLDRAITGRWLGASVLGVYSLALNLSLLPTRQITNLVNRVSFPAFSRLQDDAEALRRACVKALSHVAILSLPLALGMLAVSRELILTVYGEQWVEAIPLIGVLAFYGLMLSVASVHGPMFRAIGRPQVLFYTSLLHQALLVGLLLWLGRYGLLGICYAVLTPVVVSSVIAFVLVGRYLALRPIQLLAPLLRSGSAALLMFGAVEWAQDQLPWFAAAPAPLALLASALLGGSVYLVGTLLWNRAMLIEFAQTLRDAGRGR